MLKAVIKFNRNELWDLTTDVGKKQFYYLRNDYLQDKICKKLKSRNSEIRNEDNFDSAVFDHAKKKIKFEVVKADFYIKFTFERIQRIISRFPNTRVLRVSNPDNYIDKSSIQVVWTGGIK